MDIRSDWVEAFLAHEGHEPAGHGARHGGALRAADDEFEALVVAGAHGQHEAAARLELRVERGRRVRRRRRDGDRGEGRVLGVAERPVAVVHCHPLGVAGRGEVKAKTLSVIHPYTHGFI